MLSFGTCEASPFPSSVSPLCGLCFRSAREAKCTAHLVCTFGETRTLSPQLLSYRYLGQGTTAFNLSVVTRPEDFFSILGNFREFQLKITIFSMRIPWTREKFPRLKITPSVMLSHRTCCSQSQHPPELGEITTCYLCKSETNRPTTLILISRYNNNNR